MLGWKAFVQTPPGDQLKEEKRQSDQSIWHLHNRVYLILATEREV
jgi:hypothetical protein